MTGHFFALEYTTRSLALADRARDAVGYGVTVGVILPAEVVTLDRTLEAFTLGLTGHINQLTSGEDFSVDQIAGLVVAIFKTELHYGTTSGYVRFSEVASLSCCYTRSTTLADSDLHCTIAIGLFSFELG